MLIGIDASRAFVPDPAGPEYYSLNLIKAIAKIDEENRYILYLRQGQKPNFALPKNFKTRVVSLPYLWTQIGLALETVLRPPDVLFVPAHTLPLLTRLLRSKLPIVVTIHGLEGKFLPQTGRFLSHIYRNWSITWSVRFATRLIAVSKDTRTDIIKTYQRKSKDIKIIYEGVDIARFGQKAKSTTRKGASANQISKVRGKYGIKGEYILFVGTVQPRKNLVRLIRAFSLLTSRVQHPTSHFPHLTLVIAGRPGWLYEDILEAPGRFGVSENVKFIGRVEDRDLPALYWGAKVFVLPSLTEGFGLPILEAQAAGIPVVAAKKGAIPEVVGEAGVLVNPLSPQDIKEGLEKVLTNKHSLSSNKRLRAELIKKGKENAQKFSWKKTAHNTINFLLETGR